MPTFRPQWLQVAPGLCPGAGKEHSQIPFCLKCFGIVTPGDRVVRNRSKSLQLFIKPRALAGWEFRWSNVNSKEANTTGSHLLTQV